MYFFMTKIHYLRYVSIQSYELNFFCKIGILHKTFVNKAQFPFNELKNN